MAIENLPTVAERKEAMKITMKVMRDATKLLSADLLAAQGEAARVKMVNRRLRTEIKMLRAQVPKSTPNTPYVHPCILCGK